VSRPRGKHRPIGHYEHRGEPLLPMRVFWLRLVRSILIGCSVLGGALAIGVLGYHGLARLGWIDAILNASMILAGMGPVDPLPTSAAKLFASAYAIFSGVVFLTSVGVILSPVYHRFIHRFHLSLGEDGED
jgi:hypothetical protein